MPDDSEIYGRIVRAIWVDWALEQPDVADHPSWTLPWDKLADRDREVDMRIGSAVPPRPCMTRAWRTPGGTRNCSLSALTGRRSSTP